MQRLALITACLALGASFAACGGDDDDAGPDTTEPATTAAATSTATTPDPGVQTVPTDVVEVKIVDNRFTPRAVTIRSGQAVRWTNTGEVDHTVTAEDESAVPFDSGPVGPRNSYILEPKETVGKLSYFCTIHGRGQSGTVTITG